MALRGLISPVVIVIETEESDVRGENSASTLTPWLTSEIIADVGFRDVAICVLEVPLADASNIARARVIARYRCGKQPIHGKEPSLDVLPVEITSKTHLLQLNFAAHKLLVDRRSCDPPGR